MSTDDDEFVANEIETASALGARAVRIEGRIAAIGHPMFESVKTLVIVDTDGKVTAAPDIMAQLNDAAPWPMRRKGITRLTDADSFIAFAKRWTDSDAVIYADTTALAFTLVADENKPGATGAAWRGHRASYACPRSAEWQAWCALEGRELPQTQFADFLEERLSDLRSVEGYPTPMEVLAVARALNIKTKGTFQREINPTNGDFILVNKLETTSDSTAIPRAFAIAIPVFEGDAPYQVEVRIRFKLADGRPGFSYALHRRAEIERDAFNGVRVKIGEATQRLILSGTP